MKEAVASVLNADYPCCDWCSDALRPALARASRKLQKKRAVRLLRPRQRREWKGGGR